MVNNNNPYPDLDTRIIDLVSKHPIVKSTDIIEALKPCSESAIRAHLTTLCKKKTIKKVYQLTDMRASYYTVVD